ncbi:glycosyltransferase family 2 protein [Candidatus Woesebacteria bacterium]|nr:glycosyltransferase family 2 protein [Candidatus Woesebacteria bacterium]
MVKSGLVYSYGMGFWGANGHDGVWHIALIQSLAGGSLRMPTFAGENIQNYHIGFDLLLGLIHKITQIPVVNLYFQISPIILAILIGALTYKFVFDWQKSQSKALWALFFVYFGGGFGWIVTLIKDRQFGGESIFWSQQAVSTLINPPFALSLVIILLGLIFLEKYLSNRSAKHLVLATLCFGSLIQIKSYGSVLILSALFVSGIYEWIKKGNASILKVFVPSFLLTVLIFMPFSKNPSGLFVFQPFWFLETMLLPDRLNLPRFYSALTTYHMSGNFIKGIPAFVSAFVIFWAGNLGTRILKEILVIRWIKSYKSVRWEGIFFAWVIIQGVILPSLFIQSGTSWNTIQFIYYALFFSGILAGVTLFELFTIIKSDVAKYYLGIAVVIFTIPTTMSTLWFDYLPSRPPARLTNAELEGLNFLSGQPSGIVLTYPFDKDKANEAINNPPRPLYLYESTPYVSALSGKQTFLEDEVNLNIIGIDWKKRRKEVENFFTAQEPNKGKQFLAQNTIKLPQALASVKSIASEIVVVDMHSTDETVNIAKKAGARLFRHEKTGYVEPARNFAISKATNEWILILDADEEITQTLATELKKITEGKSDYTGDYFRIPRKNIIFEKWMKHLRWWPDYNIRFFKKGFVSWNEIIHSVPITKGKGADILLDEKYAIIHHNFESLDDYLETLIRYSWIKADELFKSDYKFNWTDLIKKPSAEFFSRYFQGEGYKDGLHGLALGILQGFGEFLIYLKIWERTKFKEHEVTTKELNKLTNEVSRDFNYWKADTEVKEKGNLIAVIKRKFKLP